VLGGLALIFLRAAVVGRVLDLVDSVVVFVYFGLFSLWSFGYTMYRYGHVLAPTAPVKVDPFMPPLFGGAQLANFEVYSYPGVGSWAMLAVGLVLAVALVLGVRGARRRERAGEPAAAPRFPAAAGR
jgi:copper chaperone NosL